MASQNMSVGSVFINLKLNQNGFNKSVGNAIKNTENRFESSVGSGKLGGAVKKLSGALAGAFAIKKVIDFGKECIDLGSDLAEVQNVVDVAFGSMSAAADNWAKNAITDFGLSEAVAKKYLGVFGSMATSFGYTTKDALDMSEKITGLVGDVSSFYNLSSDEAYTKLKSIFTGETESLKDLGVVMTQSALDQYALANGFDKTTKNMTEQEKIMLRYKFVTDKLSNASGDFARTQDSWANQTRVLALRFDSLKASVGQGLINVLTPALKLVNNVIARVQVMADAFKSVTEKIFGNAGGASSGVSDVGDAADTATSNIGGIGTAADESASKVEKMKKALSSQDELNIMSFNDTDTSGGSSSGVDASAVGALNSALEKDEQTLSKMEGTLGRIQAIFKEGFGDGLKNFDSEDFLGHLEHIKTNVTDIFNSEKLQQSMQGFSVSCENLFTSIISSTVSVGTTIANNIVTGVDKYLTGSKEYISDRLAGIFDARAEINNIVADTIDAVSNVFDVFNGENATDCTSSIIGIFSDGFLGAEEIVTKFSASAVELITGPFIDNQDKIKSSIDGALGSLAPTLDALHNGIKNTFGYFSDVYDKKIGPAITGIKDGFSSLVGNVTDNWNTHMKPVLDKLSTKFTDVWENHLQPAFNKVSDLFGSISECVSAFWNGVLVPLGEWLNDKLSPVVSWFTENIGSTLLDGLAAIGDKIGEQSDNLSEVFDWLTKVFNGEWSAELSLKFTQKKEEISKKWNDLVSPVKNKCADLWVKITSKAKNVRSAWNNLVSPVKDKTAKLKAKMTDTRSALTNKWNSLTSGIKSKTFSIKASLSTSVGNVKNFVNKIIDSVNSNVISKIGFSIQAPSWLGGKKWSWSAPKIKRLYTGAYLKANNPQLAFVGDNRTEGEFVAPESKLETAVIKAMEKRDKKSSAAADKLVIEIHVVGEDGRTIIKKINDVQRQSGKVLITI